MKLSNTLLALLLTLGLLSNATYAAIAVDDQATVSHQKTIVYEKATISDDALFGGLDDDEDLDEPYQPPIFNIEKFFSNSVIDENNVLAIKTETEGLKAPNNSRSECNNKVTICRYKVTGIGADGSSMKQMSEMQTTSPAVNIYPGAMVRVNQDMLQGKPRVLDLDRKPFSITIDNLPGIKRTNIKIEDDSVATLKGSINDAIGEKVEEFYRKQELEGRSPSATSQWTFSKFHSSEQVAAELGFKYDTLSANVSASLNVKDNSETTTIFGLFKQVFYQATYQPPYNIHEIFSGYERPTEAALDRLMGQVNESSPAGYISQVSYGQMILVRMTFNEHLTEIHAKAKAKALVGAGKLTIDASSDYFKVAKGSEIQITVIGGDSAFHGEIINSDTLEEIKVIIKYMTKFDRSTPAIIISYVVNFLRGKNLQGEDLKDKVAKISFYSDYVCKECKTYNSGFVELIHDGAYIADFDVKYSVQDPHTKASTKFSATRTGKTSGFKEIIDIPGDAFDIEVQSKVRTGLVWQPFGDIFKDQWDSARRQKYTIKGLSLNTWFETEEVD